MPIDGDFSLQIEQQPGGWQKTQASDTLFAFDRCQEFLMPNKSYLVRNLRNGKHGILTADVLAAMNNCTTFRTLDGHAQHLLKTNPSLRGHEADIQKVLKSVQSDGLTISAVEICARLAPNRSAAPLPDAPAVVITTWERPEALERLLGSMERNRENNRLGPCYIVDDSRQENNISRNREIVESFRQKGWVSLVYLGPEQLRAILQALLDKLPQHERAIRFLFDREKWADYHSCGLARNYGLLAAVGQRLLFFDDDVICETYEPVAVNAQVNFGNRQREADFFENVSDYERYRADADIDPVARHARGLGMKLGDALGLLGFESVAETSLAQTTPRTVSSMSSDSPVLISCSGWLGDPGSASNRWVGKVTRTTRERILQSEAKLESALTKRHAWLGRKQYQVQSRFNMSPLCGVDNRECLPPYFPVFRGQDAWFGKMVEVIFPESVCLEFPWAVKHIPAEDRSWDIGETDFYLDEKFPMFFEYYIDWQKNVCCAATPGERMVFLANAIGDLATRPMDSLVELHKDSSIGMQGKHMQKLIEIRSESRDAPDLWRKLIDDAINKASADIMQIIDEKDLDGFPAGLENEDLVAFWRDAWRDFADAIRAWPEIRAVAPQVMHDCGFGNG